MKKQLFIALAALMLGACAEKQAEKPAEPIVNENLKDCDITLNGIRFNKSLNGAEAQVSDSAGIITFRALPQSDYFCNPNGEKANSSVVLLKEIDNTKPFTFSAKVKSGFLPDGTYNAAVLFVYAHETHWQKLCFEQDERGNHRVVTVRTVQTSDDNNHEVFNDAEYIYYKISSDAQTIGSYYSLDGQTWQMVRLYRNDYGKKVYIGISSQAPRSAECVSTFEGLTLTADHVSDFRLGE